MKQNDKKHLTAENGRPIADNQNTQTAGVRGPVTMQDPWLVEKLAHFDREVIPERRMHAKGSGAYGTFTVTHDITAYTRASIFSEIGKKTDCFVRFSTVAGERGAADAERDIRGFAMKFYTDTGNWDLVGNNTPVFFLRDPLKFPDLNHAIKRDPRTGMRSANSNWDFWTLLPEALHQVTITMSPRGIPASFRHMHGFGSHTYSTLGSGDGLHLSLQAEDDVVSELQQHPMVSGEQGLTLAGVDQDSVDGLAGIQLNIGGEACAAHTNDTGILDDVDAR